MRDLVLKYFKNNYDTIDGSIFDKRGKEMNYYGMICNLIDITGLDPKLVFDVMDEQHGFIYLGKSYLYPKSFTITHVHNISSGVNNIMWEIEKALNIKFEYLFKISGKINPSDNEEMLIKFMGGLGFETTDTVIINPTTFSPMKLWINKQRRNMMEYVGESLT